MEILIRALGHVALFFISVFVGYLIGILLFLPRAKADAVNHDVVTIIKESTRHKLDPLLVAAIIKVESNWNHKAVGTSGELGLMQIHPKFHRDTSIKYGIAYLAELRRHCGKEAFVTCYNNGPSRRPKYPHLSPYYKKVMREYETLKKVYSSKN